MLASEDLLEHARQPAVYAGPRARPILAPVDDTPLSTTLTRLIAAWLQEYANLIVKGPARHGVPDPSRS
jgi:hypothetical protein